MTRTMTSWAEFSYDLSIAGKGGGYAHFAGKDASLAFITGVRSDIKKLQRHVTECQLLMGVQKACKASSKKLDFLTVRS